MGRGRNIDDDIYSHLMASIYPIGSPWINGVLSTHFSYSDKNGVSFSEQKSCSSTYLNAEDAAKYLNIKINYLYKLTSKGKIPFYKPNGKLYFVKKELDDWIESGRKSSTINLDDMAADYVLRKHQKKNR